MGQRSKSQSDGHESRVNSIAREPLKGFEAKLTQVLTVGLVERWTDTVSR